MDRLDDMLARYGEVVKRAQAARILGCGPAKVRRMIEDGRLLTACAGDMVDVRSIAAYIEQPEACELTARMKRRGRKWAV